MWPELSLLIPPLTYLLRTLSPVNILPSSLGLSVYFWADQTNTAVAFARHNVGFVPEEIALPSCRFSIFTLLELGGARGRKIKNAYC